jgi:hypothetical protein
MSHFRKRFVQQITHTNEIDNNIWLVFVRYKIYFYQLQYFFSQKFSYVR